MCIQSTTQNSIRINIKRYLRKKTDRKEKRIIDKEIMKTVSELFKHT